MAHRTLRAARHRMAESWRTPTNLLFEVRTPLGFSVRVTKARWELITTVKDPVMTGREAIVKMALRTRMKSARAEATQKYFSSTRRLGRDAGYAPWPRR